MGSYENIVKISEMKKKINEGDLLSAQKILDTMELKKIKNMADLNLFAEVYRENQRYEEAVDLYLKIYEKVKSRKALYHLVEVLIALNNAEDAEYYLEQYQKLAPRDYINFVFRYKIDKIKGESFERQIETLAELKKVEYTEKWAYELAKLYYKAGMEEECIRECEDIELWFGEGTYVEKARILRSTYSGEVDKERIMEEIKRRAEVIGSLGSNSYSEEEADTYNEDQQEGAQYPAEEAYDMDGDLYPPTDFMDQEDNGDFEDGLRKDVQNIMIQEQPEDGSYYDYEYDEEETDGIMQEPEETLYEPYTTEMSEEDSGQEGVTAEEAASGSLANTEDQSIIKQIENVEAEQAKAVKDKDKQDEADRKKADQDKMDQEDEHMIYKLLEEDSLDEEDHKLKQIAEELQVNMDELFGNFLHVLSVKKQLVKSLDMILNDRSRIQTLIITGAEGSGKTTLAKDIALFLYQSGKLKSSRLAKISADKLNTVDVMSKKEILKDCCMVVEKASELKRTTIDQLLDLAGQLHGDIAIIFEEEKKNMNKLFREYPKLMDILKNRIHLPQYNTEDLLGFAFACLRQKDYRLEAKAEQVLQGKINQIVKQSEPRRYLEQIYDLMQSAMNAADIRMGKQLSALASQGRLKDVEAATVTVQDINVKP